MVFVFVLVAVSADSFGHCHDQGVLQDLKACGILKLSLSFVVNICRILKFRHLETELEGFFIDSQASCDKIY